MSQDSTASFKVFGACEQCKDRIEKAAKGKGVKSFIWDENTKIFRVSYNASLTTLEKIENRIIRSGHDLDSKKAKNSIYNALPDCCHYREINASETTEPGEVLTANNIDSMLSKLAIQSDSLHTGSVSDKQIMRGVVLENDNKGNFTPLVGASAIWLETKKGGTTDSNGVFAIGYEDKAHRLVISHSGFISDTMYISDYNLVKIIMSSNKQLKEVIVTSSQRSTYVSALNPIRTQIITEKELFKAACCNLSESFETNPSVDVSYNDAVTGSKQIQLLGLSGNYTQLTIENLPGPRGIATPLGLNSIAGPWVESIQLNKGIGSVVNGYESIAGQINVELKKPENSEKFYANAYVNDFGKTDFNLNLSAKIKQKWSTALLLHDDFLNNNKIDFNKDGFRDQPTGNQFSMINRWKYDNSKGFFTQFGAKVFIDNKTGGQTTYNASRDKYTTNSYGLEINTTRKEAFGKIGYVFADKKYKSVGLQLSAIDHKQDSYFGLTTYNAKQQNFYANFIYQSIIYSTTHKFKTGLSFSYDKYDELFKTTKYFRTEKVPGAFFEYSFSPNEKFSVISGIRADHNSIYGFFATPRLHVRYEPFNGTTFRFSAGRGQRTANIFAENTSLFVSSRQMNILDNEQGKAYGLNAEVAWNKGVSVDQKFKIFHHDAMFSLDFFRNDFKNQVVVDLENPLLVSFYNLRGKSFSNSFQSELTVSPINKMELRLAYRYFDVKNTYGGKLKDRPLIANSRAFANLAYALKNWKFDYTVNFNGKKRIPNTNTNPAPYMLKEFSPAFILMNTQISKTFGKKHPMDFYLGAENLTNYFQKDVIINASSPFGNYFDASMVWGPVTGSMFYAGWRLKIK